MSADRTTGQLGALSALRTWVVVAPHGLAYVGLHDSEAGAWSAALGWPDAAEIAERKAAGWFATVASVTWQRPGAAPQAEPVFPPPDRFFLV